MKDSPTLVWWYELGRTQALGYRVLIATPHELISAEEYRARRKAGANGGRKRKRAAA